MSSSDLPANITRRFDLADAWRAANGYPLNAETRAIELRSSSFCPFESETYPHGPDGPFGRMAQHYPISRTHGSNFVYSCTIENCPLYGLTLTETEMPIFKDYAELFTKFRSQSQCTHAVALVEASRMDSSKTRMQPFEQEESSYRAFHDAVQKAVFRVISTPAD